MKKFLLFLSKTDNDILKHCTKFTTDIQVSLGIFVLFTGVLALFSGSYAISNMFVFEDPNTMVPVMKWYGYRNGSRKPFETAI